jgi:hypothetical protein
MVAYFSRKVIKHTLANQDLVRFLLLEHTAEFVDKLLTWSTSLWLRATGTYFILA